MLKHDGVDAADGLGGDKSPDGVRGCVVADGAAVVGQRRIVCIQVSCSVIAKGHEADRLDRGQACADDAVGVQVDTEVDFGGVEAGGIRGEPALAGELGPGGIHPPEVEEAGGMLKHDGIDAADGLSGDKSPDGIRGRVVADGAAVVGQRRIICIQVSCSVVAECHRADRLDRGEHRGGADLAAGFDHEFTQWIDLTLHSSEADYACGSYGKRAGIIA